MKRLLLIIFAAVMAVTANAHKKVVVEHSYSSFDAVQAEDWFSISFSRSEEYGVRITTEASVEDYIIAYAKEGVLYLVVDEKAMPADVRKMFKAKNPVLAMPRVEIFAPEIKDVTLSGNSVIDGGSLTATGSLSIELRKTAAIKDLDVSAPAFLLQMSNRAQAYMNVEADTFDMLCTHNAMAQIRVDVGRLAVGTDSFSNVSLSGNADSMSLSCEGSSKITFE